MELQGNVTVIGLDSNNYIDKTGTARTSHVANISQRNGKIIDTVRIPPELYAILKPGENYIFSMLTSSGRNGLYLRLVDIQPTED